MMKHHPIIFLMKLIIFTTKLILKNMEWIFEGIGTNILVLIVTFLLGGFTGYKIGIPQKANLKQSAGDKATQSQTGIINNYYGDKQK